MISPVISDCPYLFFICRFLGNPTKGLSILFTISKNQLLALLTLCIIFLFSMSLSSVVIFIILCLLFTLVFIYCPFSILSSWQVRLWSINFDKEVRNINGERIISSLNYLGKLYGDKQENKMRHSSYTIHKHQINMD